MADFNDEFDDYVKPDMSNDRTHNPCDRYYYKMGFPYSVEETDTKDRFRNRMRRCL